MSLKTSYRLFGSRWLAFFEEFQLERASPAYCVGRCQPKPYIQPSAPFAISGKRLFQFDPECLKGPDGFQIGRHRYDAAKMELKRGLALAVNPATMDLCEERGHGECYYAAKAFQ